SVILGTVGIPTIALMLLLALPFVDVRRERRLSRRPVAVVAAILTVLAMGVLTYKGAVATEPLASEIAGAVPTWGKREGFANNPQAVAGAKVFANAGCTTCHSYLGAGASGPGPDLSSIGKTSNRGVQGFADYVADPSKFGNTVMPPFQNLGADNLKKLGAFLQASQGAK
ncbi:MAG: c-type cytochrome, partial [Actinobacteria bacterium]|nr:c-type cytochrome [Actinomycetota bacterium]